MLEGGGKSKREEYVGQLDGDTRSEGCVEQESLHQMHTADS